MVPLKMVTGKLQIAGQRMMETLNDYRAMFYRMEIVEDKDEGGFLVALYIFHKQEGGNIV